MDKSLSEIMDINDRELKEALTYAKKLEEYGLYKKQDREEIENAIRQKQEKRHAMLREIIHEEIMKELDKEIERTKKEIAEGQSRLEKQLKAMAHASVSKYDVEIKDYKENEWIIDVEFPECESDSFISGKLRKTLFIDKEEKR